jgi:hypothetical protein
MGAEAQSDKLLGEWLYHPYYEYGTHSVPPVCGHRAAITPAMNEGKVRAAQAADGIV